jgi:hypothetical protein
MDEDSLMGKIYQSIASYLPEKSTGVFVEIGSERGEGSTISLNNLAGQHNTKLISVDINTDAKRRYEHQLDHTEFVVATGSAWARDFSTVPSDIALLYLDNFDYIWDINNVSPAIKMQTHEYAEQGIVMNNQNCQAEHMRQIIALRPCLAPDAVVVFDDTYCYNDCWIGKCGPAVVYLQAYGWSVVHQTLDCGVIMKRLNTVV